MTAIYDEFRKWASEFAERMTRMASPAKVECVERFDAEFLDQYPAGFAGGFTGEDGNVKFEYSPVRFRELVDGLDGEDVEEFLDEIIIWWSVSLEHQFWQHDAETAVLRYRTEYADDYEVLERYAKIVGVPMAEFLTGRPNGPIGANGTTHRA